MPAGLTTPVTGHVATVPRTDYFVTGYAGPGFSAGPDGTPIAVHADEPAARVTRQPAGFTTTCSGALACVRAGAASET